MQLATQTVVLGLLTGAVYALFAMGLTLIFGVLRIVSFAHGAIATLGAYAGFYAGTRAGLSPYVGVLAAIAVSGAIGYLTSAVLLRPMHRGSVERPDDYAMVMTFMLSQFIVAASIVFFGGVYHRPDGFWNGKLSVGGWINVAGDRIVAAVIALALLASLFWLVYRSDIGRGWRALTQNRLGARTVGIDVPRLSHLAFAVSTGLAGAGAAVLAPLFLVYPTSGNAALVKSFVVVVLGGLGSIPGVLAGALALGLIETLGGTYISSAYQDLYGFALVIAILIARPEGLIHRRARTL